MNIYLSISIYKALLDINKFINTKQSMAYL